MRIRRARADDADAVADLNLRAMWAAYESFVAPEHLAGVRPDDLRERWRAGLGAPEDGRTTLLAEADGGGVAGFVSVGPSRDPDAREGDGELRALYVEPRALRTGVGTALLTAAEGELADRYAAATLWVLGPNEPARRFYERHGWRVDDAPFDPGRWSWAPSVRYRKVLGGGDPAQ